ncbi:MAG TPA: ABC transporter permease [Candidatus Binatia bacterium]|nr:ABC transporter permease [Candidatus Binatia bacterium]
MSGIAAVIYRDWRQRITNLGFVFWDLFVPLAYLTLFGTGFDRALARSFVVDGQTLEYTHYLLPGVIAMTGFSVAMNTAWGFFMDKDSGIFYELLTYPITRRQLLIGKGCFNVLVSLIGALLAIFVAFAVMSVPVQWEFLPLAALVIVLTTAGWFFLMSIFAIRLSRMDAFNTVTSAAYIFLMFLSSMFYPLADLPQWFQWIARLNPMTWQVDMLRFSLLGTGASSLVLMESVAFVIFAAMCLALAVRALDEAA